MSTYHLHIYFSEREAGLASAVRRDIVSSLPGLTYLGQLIHKPVGPHPLPMFELHLPESALEAAIPIIDKQRQGLSVLIHPVAEDHLVAHTVDARWLGKQLPLNLEMLRNHKQARMQ